MSIIKITDFTKLRWVRDSGPLTCDFYPNVLHCSAGGLHPDKSLQLQTHLDDPYGLLWPVSPFSLSGITREVERDPKHPANVELISIEQPSRANPVAATILKGRMTYLGEDLIQAGGQTWQAHKFSLKVALHPQFVIWTSRQGFLLAMVTEHKHPNWMNEGLRLAHFQSAPDFR